MKLTQLNDKFSISGILTFSEAASGLIYASIDHAPCKAQIYLHGAHLTQWQPEGKQAVIFLSDKSLFVAGKAIRGGIPIIFPWFGARSATADSPRTDGPAHGFARTSEWEMVSSALIDSEIHLEFRLQPSDLTRALGYDGFELLYELRIGTTLDLRLVLYNRGATPFHFEEALHAYFAVGDVERISIAGLDDTDFCDKTDGFKIKHQQDRLLTLHGETDRPYLNTAAAVTLNDPSFQRRIIVEKSNSKTTVIWNPWIEPSAKFADMSADGWRHMVCIEAANLGSDAVVVPPGESHSLAVLVRLESMDSQL
jgi:glucose-6-phosphate 1-epimerase